ncbi:hypothetical protein [Mammaliicoccus sp. D-M17]|uniref:hypothetical protein n=1 Tax=Mammaliicoccus sp. D-M17 TaxID=2898677 RepID=UPI001EFB32A2|nr:hypothetical protein [Mammaliicoccus sp. D-M17]
MKAWTDKVFSWGIDKLEEATNFLGLIKLMILNIIQDTLNGAFSILQNTVLAYDNYKVLPKTDTFIETSSIIAIHLLVFFLIYKALNNMIKGGLGEDVDYIKTMFDTFKALIFVKLTPFLVQFFLLSINQVVVIYILKDEELNLGETAKLNYEKNLTKIFGVESLSFDSISDVGQIQWYGIFMILILGACVFIFNIYGALRLVNIAICLIIGPIIAATRVMNDEYWKVYVSETISVVFTQIFHVLCLYWVLKLMAGAWKLDTIFLVIAVLIIGMSGAHIIRRFTFASGAGEIVGGTSKLALMKYLTKVGKK